MNRGRFLALGWSLTLLSAASLACGHSMTATARGAKTPRLKTCTLGDRVEVANGDFRIIQKCVSEENLTVGDGRMEMTTWDFPIEESFADALRDDCIIRSAEVELELRPTRNPFGESLAVRDKWEFGLEEIRSLEPDGSWQTVQIDMMQRPGGPSPYTPQALRELILQGPWSRLRMEYGYDASISYARIDLRCN